MNLLFTSLIIFVIIVIIIYNYGTTSKSDTVINNEPFDNTKLVLYKTDRCGHCVNFTPTWEKLKQQGLNTQFETVDCDKQKGECWKNKVDGTPTIILHKNGKQLTYEGDRSLQSLISFVKANL